RRFFMSLIALGTIALDNILTPSGLMKDLLGGSAAHFSMSARLFTNVHLAGIIGTDFPKRHISFLKKQGVNLDSVVEQEGKSFRWVGEYKDGDFNTAITIETELGVLLSYEPQVMSEHRNIPNVFLANFDPDLQMKFLSLMDKPKFVGLDSMNLWIANKKDSVKKLMKKVDLFVLNDGEATALAEEKNLVNAAQKLLKMGPKIIVLKKGEHGVLVLSNSFRFAFPAFPVSKVVDPTGAGDTFAGGLMGYLTKVKTINEKNMRQAILYATSLASYNVEGFGMRKTAPLTLKDVDQRKKELVTFISPV
ncbi:MAG: bifunctional hydroxymethylpyrimidine kinase/phosphomethylpyrimidine kinase, partial [Candidatus Omnitrophica bacterium]|nr:bifunctional hydroxymethylpyrimidine kinase/phosphomethylpyrimidine kinase [Candidatus Omnitrophota bacterium]